MTRLFISLYFASAFLSPLIPVHGVDRGNFKTCQQSSFCRRCRAMEPSNSAYELLLNTLKVETSSVEAEMVNTRNFARFKFQFYALIDGTFRMKISELNPIKPRYEVQDALVGEPLLEKLELLDRTAEKVSIKCGPNSATITAKPFRVDLHDQNSLVISANDRGLMKFEHYRLKTPQSDVEEGGEVEHVPVVVDGDLGDEDGAWEESFKSHHDSKPHGPSAVAMDFSFPASESIYGIPEHADSFSLKSTVDTDPYRLYNLDVFEYELDNPMALYGSIPFVIAHGAASSVGVFWHNAAETWVDIKSKGGEGSSVVGGAAAGVVSSIVNLVSGGSEGGGGQEGSRARSNVDARFMSESGLIDVFFLMGPKPLDVSRQYAKLTGTAAFPPYFAFGYHQSRWNYNDQEDVKNVDESFDEHDIPCDVIWLDIEHTSGKRYFTWDKVKFPNPKEMLDHETAKGRKMVAIVDPHIKRDGGYFLHNDAEANDYYVKNKDGKIYEGWCWPGSSSYLDFFDEKVMDYYSARYLFSNYVGSTEDLHIWNDMNEPSVFNGPEVTMPKDCLHSGGLWEHRDVHNVYALMHVKATMDGLLKRTDGRLRPFILSRGHFAGTQRFAAVWTGDNAAEWGHLRISIPMCLSLSIAGIPMCGADITGFFKFPTAELFIRWYQAGAFQPFYRSHSHIDTKRREPWLMGDEALRLSREALRIRYSLLPFWYGLARQHEVTGAPYMRPLWYHYPTERATFNIDSEYLLGDSLLVHPVTEAGARYVTVHFPGEGKDIWYDYFTFERMPEGATQIPVTIEKIPVYQRGGSIVVKKERIRRASSLTHNDPFTLVVALDAKNEASGMIYLDDGQSYEYRDGKYIELFLNFANDKFTSRVVNVNPQYTTKERLEKVVIVGIAANYTKAEVECQEFGKVLVDCVYDDQTQVLVIRKPWMNMGSPWSLQLLK
ncbi:neutral alpha-glucosidase AB [Ischnura elegans]|uniref:neutral alpha-glucosidase AB n=1 Tax=Ischnura elegans TaxID=197161 RepID=UPI001ED87D85|nr:neutral alpha-glucosidase AB [Ischnura elegans]